jgi:hypothetical protein
MAADSALTQIITLPNGNSTYCVLAGVHKLQVIEKLNAGISVWGMGAIPPSNTQTDIWLQDFINNQIANYNSLSDFATLLQNELRRHISQINVNNNPLGTIGFHLAGYVNYNGSPTPTLYHIHNGISTTLSSRGIQINPAIVNANHDIPPNLAQQYLSQGIVPLYRNGDWTTYANFFNHVGQFLQGLSQQGLTIPHSRDLRERAEWLKFQIKTMSELYRLSNLHLPTIGGKIDTLLITPNGIDDCGLTL